MNNNKKAYFDESKRKISNLGSFTKDPVILINDFECCGNCDHLLNRYFKLDPDVSKFPLPFIDCKNKKCSAFIVACSIRTAERMGAKKI